MNMKKFLLVILAFSLLSFSASAYGVDLTLTVDSSENLGISKLTIPPETSGDESVDVYIVTKYVLTSIKDAVEFANGPLDYIAKHPETYDASLTYSSDVDYYENIAIKLNVDDCLGGTIDFGNYSNITDVTINESGTTRTFSNPGGKHFILSGSTNFTLENVELNGGSLNGGIEIGGGTAIFNNVDVVSTVGTVKISGDEATFTSCNFTNNVSTSDGGAVDISGGEVVFSGCTFSNNTSSANGGAVNVSGGTSIEFKNTCTFTGNTAGGNGGAVNISNVSALSFSPCSFTGNYASVEGGAISITGGSGIEFISTRFTNNSSDVNGGAISVTGSATVSFSAGSYYENSSKLGGALYMSDGSVSFSGNNPFTNNSADNGGAMYVSGGSSLEFSSRTSFRNNTATTNGGAVFVNASSLTPDFSVVTFSNNKAVNGGAMYLRSPATIGGTFSGNFASTNGGAVYINNSLSSVTINSVAFSTNSADNYGGAMYLNSSATFSEANFSENYATSNGGGVFIAGGNSITFGTENNFTSNTVSNDGGAVYIDGGSSIAFSGSNTFTTNIADDSGGAIYINKGSNISFSGTNTFEANYSPNEGGAVTISSSGNIPSFTDVEFKNNSADNQGGTIAILNGGATLDGATSFLVSSSDKGGAVYITNGTLTINDEVTFEDITANDGGIIHMTGGTANIYAELKNTTANNGGAIYMTNGTANIYGVLSSNTALENGGAICLSGDLPVVNVHNNLTGNKAANGGAIYVQSGTILISGDSSASDVTLSGNVASNYGGAIYINGSRARLNVVGSCPIVFSTNTAASGGGAIYAYEGTISNFTPLVTFSSNTTTNGNGGALWLLTANQAPAGKLTFENNTSKGGSGGAIYVASETATNLTLDNTTQYTFDHNVADECGGAVHTVASTIILDAFDVDFENSAKVGGGFASSETGKIYIRNNSSISNQWAPTGGAFYAPDIYVTSSDLTENHTEQIEGGENGHGGGAIYATRHLEITGGYFYANYATQQIEGHGGAIYVNGSSDDVKVTNSLFIDNATTKGNGGSIYCDNITGSVFETNTFRENTSGTDGGAIYIQGNNFTIKKCYFEDNHSDNNGGAVYFAQPNDGTSPTFTMNYSMFKGNNAAGDNGGGALYIGTVNAKIDSCTFTENFLDTSKNSGVGYGGALYLYTRTPTETLATLDSCTFYKNRIDNGSDESSGGGALYLDCEKGRIRSCTFTSNTTSGSGGGAICLASGTLSISGTIAVGNTTIGRYDIRLHEGSSRIVSGGYNRIGKFGQGAGETDFKSVTSNNDSDRTSWLNKTWMTIKESYFGDNELAVNSVSDGIPPSIGSTLGTGQVVLLTLMLNEASTLPVDDRATNMIPYDRKSSFPELDERGTTRAILGPNGERIAFDIGATALGITNTGGGSGEVAAYSVVSIQMSGLPNELRRVGQTASLVAKVYYSNGREAYGGTGENEEPVKWSSYPSDYYVHVDENTGDLVVLRTTSSPESSTYVKIIVETLRTDSSGNTFKDSQYVKITEGDFAYLNTSPLYAVTYLRDLINDFIEYNIGFGLADTNSSTVTSSTFQSNFASVYYTSAFQVYDLTVTEPVLTIAGNYPSSGNFVAAKDKGVNIDFAGRKVGDIFPVMYTWNFTGDELKKIVGYDLLKASFRDDASLAEDLFDVLKLEFQGAEGKLPVIGSGGVSAREAVESGAMALNNYDGDEGVQIVLTAYVANVASGESNAAQLISSDGSKLLVVPDGVPYDGRIYGTMWLAQDESKTQATYTVDSKAGEQASNTLRSNSNSNTSSSGEGGSGCDSLLAGEIIALMVCLIFMKRK